MQRARDAETARHEAVEALKKEEAESARLRDENEKTLRELATTNYVLSARRDAERALAKQAGSCSTSSARRRGGGEPAHDATWAMPRPR